MSVYKIYSNAFSKVMERHGFIYKNKMFIRKMGDDIIQALSVNGRTTYYNFEVAIFPLWVWAAKIQPRNITSVDDCVDYIKKKHWVQQQEMTFYNYRDFPFVERANDSRLPHPYLPSLPSEEMQKVVLNFEKAAELTEELYIPMFDKITDFHSYMEWMEKDGSQIGIRFGNLCKEELIYKAYLDGNFLWGMKYFFERRECLLKQRLDAIESTNYSQLSCMAKMDAVLLKDTIKGMLAKSSKTVLSNQILVYLSEVKKREGESFKLFYDCMEQNDCSWIVDEQKKMHKDSMALFKRVYKDIF